MFQPIRTDPPPDRVRRITFVPFLTDGRCVLIDEPRDPALPSGGWTRPASRCIWVGNAVNWRPPGGMRFDYVHILLDCVPQARRADLIQHHLAHTVRPGTGRLLVSDYAADPAAGHPAAAETLTTLGFRCAGQTSGDGRPGRPSAPTAWVSADLAP